MSISNEITRLQTAKSNLKSAIENKGVTVPSATKLDGYASLVDGIEGGGGGFTADDIAMRTISGVVSGSAAKVLDYAFRHCYNLTTVNFPQAGIIGSYAFTSCYNLTTASFQQAGIIGSYAFQYCSKLTTISFPQVSSIGYSAFQSCYSLTTASFPQAGIIGSYAFYYCFNLTTVSFPQASSIGNSAFQYCSKLTTISFPQVSSIGLYAFANCYSLTKVIFSKTSTAQGTIYTYAFRSCYHLTSLYLLASTLYRLSSNYTAFQSTPISNYTASTGGVHGSIFVRQSLYDAYISSTNWSYYSSRFVGLTDEQVEYVMEHGTHIME